MNQLSRTLAVIRARNYITHAHARATRHFESEPPVHPLGRAYYPGSYHKTRGYISR